MSLSVFYRSGDGTIVPGWSICGSEADCAAEAVQPVEIEDVAILMATSSGGDGIRPARSLATVELCLRTFESGLESGYGRDRRSVKDVKGIGH
jgi:hypothetical protein